MSKISNLPALTDDQIDGSELAPVTKAGQTFAASIAALGSRAAIRAEAAADVANAQRKYYQTTAAGVAATDAPDIFVSDEDGTLRYYRADGTAIRAVATGEQIAVAETRIDTVEARVATYNAVIRVGAGGDVPTAIAGFEALKAQNWIGSATLDVLERNTPDSDEGSMAFPDAGYTFRHPNARSVFMAGPQFAGGAGHATKDDMTGDEAADLAFLKGRFGASIRLNGDADASNGFHGGQGLSLPNGFGGFNRMLLEMRNRYNLDLGFGGSHANSGFGGAITFRKCAGFGGVWAALGAGMACTYAEGNLFAYQKSGGPVNITQAGRIRVVSGYLDLYARPSDANQAKTGILIDAGGDLTMDPGPGIGIRMKGSFSHGIKQRGGRMEARNLLFEGVCQPLTIEGGIANVGRPVIKGARTNAAGLGSDLEPTLTHTQEGIVGNSGQGALVHAGMGAVINHSGFAIDDCDVQRYFFGGGGSFKGYGSVNVGNSRATVSAMEFLDSVGNSFRKLEILNSLPGSNNIVTVDGYLSTVRFYEALAGATPYCRARIDAAGANLGQGALALNKFNRGSMIAAP